MSELDEAIRYGKYVAFMIDTCKHEGIDSLLVFIEDMDAFQAKMLLAYLIQNHAQS